MDRVGFIILSALLVSLASGPVSAGGDGYRSGERASARAVCRDWRCRGTLVRYLLYSPPQYYTAFYYRGRGGIGRGYWTTAYSTDGYPHHYRD
jgi:hypothetical protein